MLEALRLSPLYHWTYGTVTTDSYVSVDKAARVLGFEPRYSNQQALRRNFEWYLAHRDRFGDAVGVSHRKPWKQGALRLAKWLF